MKIKNTGQFEFKEEKKTIVKPVVSRSPIDLREAREKIKKLRDDGHKQALKSYRVIKGR